MFQVTPHPKTQIISVLATMREEWQQSAQGASLLDMEANVGLMLADLVNCLNLTEQEQEQVLGRDLFNELQKLFFKYPEQ